MEITPTKVLLEHLMQSHAHITMPKIYRAPDSLSLVVFFSITNILNNFFFHKCRNYCDVRSSVLVFVEMKFKNVFFSTLIRARIFDAPEDKKKWLICFLFCYIVMEMSIFFYKACWVGLCRLKFVFTKIEHAEQKKTIIVHDSEKNIVEMTWFQIYIYD